MAWSVSTDLRLTDIRPIRRQGPAARDSCRRMAVRLEHVHTPSLRLRCSPRSIAPHHLDTEVRELFDALWRAGIVRHHATRFWRKAERQGHVELCERLRLPVEPRQRLRAQPIGPAQTGTQVGHAEATQPLHGVIKAVVLKMKPLTDA